jgi:histidyl-tRNA synthetase
MHLLGEVDRERLRRNPLRVLDSKERGMEELLAHAPHITDHLCEDCADHFAELRRLLDALGQSYVVNYRLVRGIDYYVKTVFEIWASGIGAQSALVGGGRYDGLAEAIGGPHTPAVGFGSGIERLVMVMQNQGIEAPPAPLPRVMVTHFGGDSKVAAVQTVEWLRQEGIGAYLSFARGRRSLKSQLREANKYLVRFALIIGEEELADGTVILKPMAGGDQLRISLAELVNYLSAAELLRSPGEDNERA